MKLTALMTDNQLEKALEETISKINHYDIEWDILINKGDHRGADRLEMAMCELYDYKRELIPLLVARGYVNVWDDLDEDD